MISILVWFLFMAVFPQLRTVLGTSGRSVNTQSNAFLYPTSVAEGFLA